MYRITILRVNVETLEFQNVLSVRVKSEGKELECIANTLLANWLNINPNQCATWSVSSLSAEERGIYN